MLSWTAELFRAGGVAMYATTLMGSTAMVMGLLICFGALNRRWLKLGVGILLAMLCMAVSHGAFELEGLASYLDYACSPEDRMGTVYDFVRSIAAVLAWSTMFAAPNALVYGWAFAQRAPRSRQRAVG